MAIIGITGSIGVGKSTVTRLLARMGYKILNSDKLVHQFFTPNHDVFVALTHKWPFLKLDEDKIDTQTLGDMIFFDKEKKEFVENLIHPLVLKNLRMEIKDARDRGEDLVVEVPLLFETGAEKYCDFVIVVVTDPKIQRKRVLSRPHMTEKKFRAILKNQLPDHEKEKRADYVIRTLSTQADLRYQIEAILADMERRVK